MLSTRQRAALLITCLVVVAGGAGYAIALATSWHGSYGGYGKGGSSNSAYGSYANPGKRNRSGAGAGAGTGSGFSDSALATSIGKRIGLRLQGQAPAYLSTSQAAALAGQAPAGATVNKAADSITFTGTKVSFVVVSVLPGGADMTFRVAGLTNPAIVVPQGAQVTVRFINADPDQGHGWLVTSEQPPFQFGQSKVPSISGAYAPLIGDPTSTGDGTETITFTAAAAGSYQYICPVPGHAQMGMHGTFTVR
jgi:rusticyanin